MKTADKSRRGATNCFSRFSTEARAGSDRNASRGRGAVVAFMRSHGDENSKFSNQWAAQDRADSAKTAPAKPALGSGKRVP